MAYSKEIEFQMVSIFAVFVIWFLSLIPIRAAQKKAGYNNNMPREQYKELV
jgi:uncharacterized MAPEG superfamily protein